MIVFAFDREEDGMNLLSRLAALCLAMTFGAGSALSDMTVFMVELTNTKTKQSQSWRATQVSVSFSRPYQGSTGSFMVSLSLTTSFTADPLFVDWMTSTQTDFALKLQQKDLDGKVLVTYECAKAEVSSFSTSGSSDYSASWAENASIICPSAKLNGIELPMTSSESGPESQKL